MKKYRATFTRTQFANVTFEAVSDADADQIAENYKVPAHMWEAVLGEIDVEEVVEVIPCTICGKDAYIDSNTRLHRGWEMCDVHWNKVMRLELGSFESRWRHVFKEYLQNEEQSAEKAGRFPSDMYECEFELYDYRLRERVKKAAVNAYSDCNSVPGRRKTRELSWMSDEGVSLDDWSHIMSAATPGGYNDFSAVKVAAAFRAIKGHEHLEFYPAREGSVAVYVKGPESVLERIETASRNGNFCEDERSRVGERIRMWWD